MPMTHYSENSVSVGIPLTNMNGKTIDTSEYLDFGFNDKVWFKDNDGLYYSEHVRCLGISHRTGRLMFYHIITHVGKVYPYLRFIG